MKEQYNLEVQRQDARWEKLGKRIGELRYFDVKSLLASRHSIFKDDGAIEFSEGFRAIKNINGLDYVKIDASSIETEEDLLKILPLSFYEFIRVSPFHVWKAESICDCKIEGHEPYTMELYPYISLQKLPIQRLKNEMINFVNETFTLTQDKQTEIISGNKKNDIKGSEGPVEMGRIQKGIIEKLNNPNTDITPALFIITQFFDLLEAMISRDRDWDLVSAEKEGLVLAGQNLFTLRDVVIDDNEQATIYIRVEQIYITTYKNIYSIRIVIPSKHVSRDQIFNNLIIQWFDSLKLYSEH